MAIGMKMKNSNPRRTFLKTSFLAGAGVAATGLLSSKFVFAGTSEPVLIGVSDWIPEQNLADLKSNYLADAPWLNGRELKFIQLPTKTLFDHRDSFHALITSPTFHPWLYPEHAFFTSLPFGLSREQKEQWLNSEKGSALVREYFGYLNLFPHAVAQGSEHVGVLSKKPIRSIDDLNGMRIAVSDLTRKDWFESKGSQAIGVDPREQKALLLSGRLDSTELYTAEGINQLFGTIKSTNLVFNLMPRMKTAPVLFTLWTNKISKADLASTAAEDYRRRSFSKSSAVWSQRDQVNLADLKERVQINEVPSKVLSIFSKDSHELRSKLASRNHYSARLEKAYSEFESSQTILIPAV